MITEKQSESLRITDALMHSIARYGREDTFTLDAYEALKELRRLHAQIAELEAQLDAVGAGGVGRLIGKAEGTPP